MKVFALLATSAAIGVLAVSALSPPGRRGTAGTETVAVPPGVTDGSAALGLDLLGVGDRTGNAVLSPTSITAALAMTAAGAAGETRAEMLKALRLPDDPALHAALGKALRGLADDPNRKTTLSLANGVWAQGNDAWKPPFLAAARDDYGARLEAVDFPARHEQVTADVNRWVADQTRGLIKDLIGPGVVDRLTRMVLVNALYFKGDWATPFSKRATTNAPFRTTAGSERPCKLMNRTDKLPYAEDADFHAVELDYTGGELSFLALVPKTKGGLTAAEPTLTADRWQKLRGGLRPRKVALSLPRFKLEAKLGLRPALEKLGMRQAFDRNQADFSGMTASADGLYITAVVHQATIEVNEEGTEAAAATAVVMAPRSMAPRRDEPVAVRADHPFLFFLLHKRSGLVLFAGRVAAP